MNVEGIEQLEEFLKQLGPDEKVTYCKLSRPTVPRPNYGHLMLRLEVTIVDKDDIEDTGDFVLKLLPPDDQVQEAFDVKDTFKTEVNFYKKIVPLLKKFEKDHEIRTTILNLFPDCYAARLSLDPNSDRVDKNAALLLQNLQSMPDGFTTLDRFVGFDFETAKILLKNLAHFHAIPLALKMEKRRTFEREIKCYLRRVESSVDDFYSESIIVILKENQRCVPYVKNVQKLLMKKPSKRVTEPFATITHNDCWVNNIMLKFRNDKPVESKMINYQFVQYKSPCRDLLFFLFSSVQQQVLMDKLDNLLAFYHIKFLDKLVELKCDTKRFHKLAFDEEVNSVAKSEYVHLALMLYRIFTTPREVTDEEQEPNDMSVEEFNQREVYSGMALKRRLWFATLEFAKRGWLR